MPEGGCGQIGTASPGPSSNTGTRERDSPQAPESQAVGGLPRPVDATWFRYGPRRGVRVVRSWASDGRRLLVGLRGASGTVPGPAGLGSETCSRWPDGPAPRPPRGSGPRLPASPWHRDAVRCWQRVPRRGPRGGACARVRAWPRSGGAACIGWPGSRFLPAVRGPQRPRDPPRCRCRRQETRSATPCRDDGRCVPAPGAHRPGPGPRSPHRTAPPTGGRCRACRACPASPPPRG